MRANADPVCEKSPNRALIDEVLATAAAMPTSTDYRYRTLGDALAGVARRRKAVDVSAARGEDSP